MTESAKARRIPEPDEVRAVSGQYDVFTPPALRQYLDVALDRLLHTLRLLSTLPLEKPRVLEIGARPYFMTMLLTKYLEYDVTALNEPPEDGEPSEGVQQLRDLSTGEVIEVPFRTANVERDTLPFAAESFDLVLFCEVIEHLMHDPTRALVEIHRVLKKDGYLLISTPNALRWEYLRRMLRGENYYPPYSGYGATARHNREFSATELEDLLEGCGFRPSFIQTVRDAAYDHPVLWDRVVTALTRMGRCRGRLDVIHAMAQPDCEARFWYPESLYYDIQGYRRVAEPFVRMGTNDHLQVEHHGFYAPEHWPPTVRWTKRQATVYLRGSGQDSLALRFFTGGRSTATLVTVSIETEVIGKIECPPMTWLQHELPLFTRASGEIKVDLQVDEPYVPHMLQRSSDKRELGVAVEWLELR